MPKAPSLFPAYILIENPGEEDVLILQYRRSYYDAVIAHQEGSTTATIYWVARSTLENIDGFDRRQVLTRKELPARFRALAREGNAIVKKWFQQGTPEHGAKGLILLKQVTDTGDFTLRLPSGQEADFIGYTKAVLKVHKQPTLERIMHVAFETCAQQWAWPVDDVRFTFMIHEAKTDQRQAMGMAFAPGSGPTAGVRRISLHRDLMRNYDEAAILRVVLHELAHHYREEIWPRTRTRYDLDVDAHDHLFCAALSQVDPLVAGNKQECMRFTDVQWEQGYAAQQEQKRQASYEYGKGVLFLRTLKNGRLKIDWAPDTGRKKVMDFHPEDLKAFLQNFTPKERPHLPVATTPFVRRRSRLWSDPNQEVVTLYELIERAHRVYPSVGFDTLF